MTNMADWTGMTYLVSLCLNRDQWRIMTAPFPRKTASDDNDDDDDDDDTRLVMFAMNDKLNDALSRQ